MTLLYFHASALVKGYVYEEGSECVAQIFVNADHVFTCKIAFAEIMATFRRKRDELHPEVSRIDERASRFYEDWESFATIDLSPGLLDVVRTQAFRHALRALDLLHLSAAMWLRRIATTPVVLVSSDQDQLAAARRESLPVFDPEHDDPATLV